MNKPKDTVIGGDWRVLFANNNIPAPTAYNRAYLVSLHFTKIQPNGWTSDTLGTLYAICLIVLKYPKFHEKVK